MPEKPRGRQRVFPARDSNMNLISGRNTGRPGAAGLPGAGH